MKLLSPYYQDPQVTLYLGETIETMRQLPDETFDLAFPDPPYAISVKKSINRQLFINPKKRRQRPVTADMGDWDHFPSKEVFAEFSQAWLRELYRVLKPNGQALIWFANLEVSYLRDWAVEAGFRSLGHLSWHKLNPCPNVQTIIRYASSTEALLWFGKGKVKTWNGGANIHNFIETGICQGNERTEHPCQKPEIVLSPFIQRHTNPGDLILDPFTGSGSVPKVAKQLGRRCVGIEGSKKWIELAADRCRQDSLFFLPGQPLAVEATQLDIESLA